MDWGDGTVTTHTSSSSVSRSYESDGTYTITLTGDFGGLSGFDSNRTRLRRIVKWGSYEFQSMSNAFRTISNLQIATDAGAPIFSSSGVNCTNLFFNASSFNSDLSQWDVSNITAVTSMFRSTALSTANFNATLIGWSTQSVRPGLRFNNIPNSIPIPPTDSDARAAYDTLTSAPNNWTIRYGN